MKDASLKKYLIGFGASFVLTISAYLLVLLHIHNHHRSPTDNTMVFLLIVLAVVQLAVQLAFFLHLGQEKSPKWNLVTFGVMGGVVLIFVLGSLWIMYNLNYNQMGSQQTNSYIINDEGFGRGH